MIYFTAHTIKCVCHSIRTMFRVLGICNFGLAIKTTCFTQYLNYLNLKGEDSSCRIDKFRTTYTFKTKMGMVCLIFEPHPENQYNF